MIFIEKTQPSQEITDALNQAKRDFRIQSPEEAAVAFDSLTKRIKDLIRDSLIEEQHGLCAYCMKRIEKSDPDKMAATTIEHYKPKSKYFDLTLDYKNMLAVCSGGRGKDKGKKCLCCDASKGDREIKINPFSRNDMEKIRYRPDGTIFTKPLDEDFERDINETLKLNGERDNNGDMINDTSTELVKCRREAYKNLFLAFIKGLKSKSKLSRRNIEKRIHELEQEEPYRECVGIVIYFLRRELTRYD